MLHLVEIVVCWAVALFTFSSFGATVLQLLNVERKQENELFQHLVCVLAGITVFNFLAGLISIFLPITANVTALLFFLAVMLNVYKPIRVRSGSVFNGLSELTVHSKVILIVLGGLVLWTAGLPSLNYDTGLYHDQFIKWINQHPAVPGLANLHERFGFNSHWHLLAASFNGYPYLAARFNDMGALLVVVFLASAVEALQALFQRKDDNRFNGLLALSLVPLYLLARFLTSDTPDLPNSIIGFTVLAIPFYPSWSNVDRLKILAIIGALLVSIKVSSVLLLVVALPSLKGVDWKKIALAFALGLLALSPWLIRNYTFSGYLVYPAKFTGIGSPDYQAPEESLDYVNALLESHGRFGYYDVNMVGRPLSEWLFRWFEVQTTSIKLMLLFSLVMVVVLTITDLYRLLRAGAGYRRSVDLLVHIALLLSMAIVFKLAPEIRYSYGVLLFYFCYLLLRVGLERWRWAMISMSILGLLMFTRIVFIVSNEPPPPVRSKTYKVMEGSALPIYYPAEFDQCLGHELPCTNRFIEGLEMRTDKLEDGFRRVP